MHEQEPAPGGLPARPDGNRPANNARLSTPGTVGSNSFQGGAGAIDFLGLGEELGVEPPPQPSPVQPARRGGAQPAPRREEPVWDEYDPQDGQHVVSLDEEEEDDALQEGRDADEEVDEEPRAGVLASWKEDEPVARGRGRLAGLCAGVAVAGMLTVALLKLVSSSSSSEGVAPEPLAAHRNPLPNADQLKAPDAPEGLAKPQRLVYDAEGQAQPTELRPELATPPPDPAATARERFESARGDQPPPGFDPAADTPPAPAAATEEPAYESGLSEPHVSADPPSSSVPQSAPSEAPSEPVVASTAPEAAPSAGVQAATASSSWPEPVELAPATSSAVASAPEASQPPVELASAAANAPQAIELVGTPPQGGAPVSAGVAPPQVESASATNAAGTTESSRSWLDLAALRAARQSASSTTAQPAAQEAPSASAPVASAVEPAPAQPASSQAPSAETTPPQPATGPVDQLLATRDPRPSAIASEPPVPPDPGPGGLRQASSTDYKGVWQSTNLPGKPELSANPRLLTPNVGRVRVVLKSGDVFEGRLFAVGEGNLWLESSSGRMGLSGERLASLEQIITPEGTPALGEPGSQALAGMERVRVKTPGGVFYGKVIARDAERTTIVTDDGARLTLDSKMVELLVDAPKVTIKGTAPQAEGEKPAAKKKP
jgi:ribonuclease E